LPYLEPPRQRGSFPKGSESSKSGGLSYNCGSGKVMQRPPGYGSDAQVMKMPVQQKCREVIRYINGSKPSASILSFLLIVISALFSGCGGGGGGGGNNGGGTGPTVPAAPTGLSATAGSAQASLSWNASTGATSYHLKRSTTSGGSYAIVATPAVTSYTDTGLTNGTTYYYVVSALNVAGESPNSAEASVTPAAPVVSVQVTIDALSDRHPISPLVYGVNFPPSQSYITDSGATLIRWGGNASTCYNWTNSATNAANDFYFINRPMNSPSPPAEGDAQQFVSDVISAGGYPLMTMPMVDWVAKDTTHYSFSVAKYGPQCQTSPYNSGQGNGGRLSADG
jgi:Glycoside hydrolase family 44/Fibronectin type III domain